MSFPAPKFTDAGKQIQLKAIAGTKLKITKMEIGSGSSKNVDITKLTGLVKTEHTFSIVSQEKRDKIVEIIATFNNEEIKTPFEFREIGVFAQDPDTNQEVLYCYSNCGDVAEKIESTTVSFIEKTIRVPINVGDASNIEIVVQPGAYVTQVELNEAMTPVTGFYKGSDITLVQTTVSGFDAYVNEKFKNLGFAPKLIIIQDNKGNHYVISKPVDSRHNGIVTNNFDKFGGGSVYASFTADGLGLLYLTSPSSTTNPTAKNVAADEDTTYFYMIFR